MTESQYNQLQQELTALIGKYKQKNIASSKYADVYKQAILACKSVVSAHKDELIGGQNNE